jgi:hypothetical protein
MRCGEQGERAVNRRSEEKDGVTKDEMSIW